MVKPMPTSSPSRNLRSELTSRFPAYAKQSLAGVAILFLPAATATSAVVQIHDEVAAPTPRVLAYNLGHFYPGSNTADWWRYSRASGARIFLSPSHFEVGWTARPGDAEVVDRDSFLARRDALRADPLNPEFILWSGVQNRFNTVLSGNNSIVPQFALEEIHRQGGTILAQMTLGESSFPINGESDWKQKWVAWRVFYSIAFYLAREFDVERFASHNEPNHPNSFIAPNAWLLRLRLASDAAHCAIEDVNRIYGKNLTARFTAPVTAGTTGSAYEDYGRLAVTNLHNNYLGGGLPGTSLFQTYSYQQYNQTPANFASQLGQLRDLVSGDLPGFHSLMPFALTEFNVHTGATYDEMPETPDTLAKAVRFGAIATRLLANGLDEFYAFKFGMTAYPSSRNYPVQKNGMLYVDNDRPPYNYGGMTRSGEVYRLFCKAFTPGRELLQHTLSGSGASNLEIAAARDAANQVLYLFSVNTGASASPLEIDLTAFAPPEGNSVVVEDVSQWRTGIVRSMHAIEGGRVLPGNQPGNTVWLLTIPLHPQLEAGPLTLLATQDAMVKDGSNASQNYGASLFAWAKNDPTNTNARNAAFIQFDLPAEWRRDRLQTALLRLPVAAIQGNSEYVQVQVYGIDNHEWNESTLTWSNAPNLRKGVPAGKEIRHRVIDGAGETAHLLAQLSVPAGRTEREIDVTDYLRRQSEGKASFLLVQDPRWDIDIHGDSVPARWSDLPRGDTPADGIELLTKEGAGPDESPASLIVIQEEPRPMVFLEWIQKHFPDESSDSIIGFDADPDQDGLSNLLEFAIGSNPAQADGHAFLGRVREGADGAVEFQFSESKLSRGVVLHVETSVDLVHWSSGEVEIQTAEETPEQKQHVATLSEPEHPRAFFRLRAEPEVE